MCNGIILLVMLISVWVAIIVGMVLFLIINRWRNGSENK